MNSVLEQCPNSDPKQYIVTKLGWVHSAHTQNSGCAHTALAVPMSWALLRAQQACRARSQRRSCACWACTCPDTPKQPAPRSGRDIVPGRDLLEASLMSRHQIGVATPLRTIQVATSEQSLDTKPPPCSLNHVATSNRCRDTTQAYPGRDTKTRSRPSWRLPYVATLNSCRDTVSAHSGLSRLRHRNPCRDLPHCHPCRDINSMSRHQFHVATPLPPNQSRPGRDTTSWSRPHAQPNSVLPSARLRHHFLRPHL